MDWTRINGLLEKYWEGDTTVDEEKELKQFFGSCPPEQIPEELRETAALFQYYAREEAQHPLGESFDAQILDTLSKRPFLPVNHRQPNQALENRSESRLESRSLYTSLITLAACLVLVVTAVLVFRNRQDANQGTLSGQGRHAKSPTELGTYEDPQKAYEETKKALLMVSIQLNKGRTYTKEIQKINEAENLIKQGNPSEAAFQ